MYQWNVIFMGKDFTLRRMTIEASDLMSLGGLLKAYDIESPQVLVVERTQVDHGQLRPPT